MWGEVEGGLVKPNWERGINIFWKNNVSVWNDRDIVHKLCGDLRLTLPYITVILYLAQLPWCYYLGLFL